MERKKPTPKQEATFEDEFESTDYGQGEIPTPVFIQGPQRRGRPRVGRKFNVTMPEELIERLQRAAEKRGVGYQTMIRLICTERVDEYLVKKPG